MRQHQLAYLFAAHALIACAAGCGESPKWRFPSRAGQVTNPVFSPSGDIVVYGSRDRGSFNNPKGSLTIRSVPGFERLDVQRVTTPIEADNGARGGFLFTALSVDGRTVITVAHGSEVQFRSAETLELISKIDGFPSPIRDLAYISGADEAAVLCSDQTSRAEIIVCDCLSRKIVRRTEVSSQATALAYIEGLDRLISGGGHAPYVVWNIDTLVPIKTIASKDYVNGILPIGQGLEIVTVGISSPGRHIDLSDGRVLRVYGQDYPGSLCAGVSPNKRVVAVGYRSKRVGYWGVSQIVLWEIKSGRRLATLYPKWQPNHLAFDPTSRFLAAGLGLPKFGELVIWDLAKIKAAKAALDAD